MVIFYHIPYPDGRGADRWIFDGWRNAFVDLGHRVYAVRTREEIRRLQTEIQPHLLMTSYSLWNLAIDADFLYHLRISGCRTAMFVDPDFLRQPTNISLAREGLLADLFFGERSREAMTEFVATIQQPYRVIANAADRTRYFPAAPSEKYRCDIAYVGAYLPKKRIQFKKLLLPLVRRYRVQIYGPYWTWKDLVLLAGSKLCRRLEFLSAADWFTRRRPILPVEEERQLYASVKICPNFHEREGERDYDLVNQRTFKIAASGGFQICDRVPSLRQYFAADEVLMTENDADWFSKIDYYLSHDHERRAIQKKGTARALCDHTYHHRVKQLLETLALNV